MTRLIRQTILIAGFLTGVFGVGARAQNLDQIGVTALRAVATNLDGSGVRVAQPEAYDPGTTNFEVNPGAVGHPSGFLTYISANGSTTSFPNALSGESGHANSVGQIFYGQPGGVATNVVHADNYDANYFVTAVVQTLTAIPDAVVNQSFVDSNLGNQSIYDTIYDNYAAKYGTLFVSGAGNGGSVLPPSTCYNGLSIGAYAGGSSVGPTADNGRCKPDLVAPAGETSFSTPQVAGAAALLLQAALRGDGGGDTNSAADIRTIKALLLNGAVKPLGWTNSNSSPLDARYGAGVVNALNAYGQLAGGKHACIVTSTVPLNAAHPPTGATGTVSALSGWNFATNTSGISSDSIQHYYFNVSNAVRSVKFTATATLVWNRQTNYFNINSGLNDLDLLLYDTASSNLVAASISYVNNVEHLYVTNLAQGCYDLQVWKAGGTPGVNIISAVEPYALAWEFVTPPTLAVSVSANPVLAWPVYPAGFLVETRTNLLSDAWNTNGIAAPTITNGQNSILLNPTNAAQFFRLRSPNF